MHDMCKPLPFATALADAVSGGIVRIVVPDRQAIVQEYLGERPFGKQSAGAKLLAPGDLLNERFLMRWPSPQSATWSRACRGHAGFSFLQVDVRRAVAFKPAGSAGFVDVARKMFLESAIPNIYSG